MDRRRVALAAAVLTMAVLVVAASSGPVRVWVVAQSDGTGSSGEVRPADTVAPATTSAPDGAGSSQWGGAIVQLFAVLVGVGVLVAIAIVAAGAGRDRPWRWRGLLGLLGRFGLRSAGPTPPATPPTAAAPVLVVDVAAARLALSTGTPRDAIVRCWLQLEDDASAMGLPRRAAETPAEYVERVVRASSLDPGPIQDLAALYREARFSRHELGDQHRTRALTALQRVGAALRQELQVPS